MSYNNANVKLQLENYIKGFPFLKVQAPATTARGISLLDAEEQASAIRRYEDFKGKIVKFVPASGAASRMFKVLFEAREDLRSRQMLLHGSHGKKFFDNITKFPFYDSAHFKGLSQEETLNYILDDMRYAYKPKGEILFHKYDKPFKEVRTAFEEHLVEGALYAKNSDGTVHIHFTVSPEHKDDFQELSDEVSPKYEKRFDCKYDINFSTQDPSTNIIAVNEDNTPFLKQDGTPLFRPGGHGALLQNLNETDGDIVFLKNIDNVIRQEFLDRTILWKKVIAGRLLQSRNNVFAYLKKLEPYILSHAKCVKAPKELCDEIISFIDNEFCITLPNIPEDILPHILFAKLNRPIRVCGMVKNEGEPGGGPFITYDADGSTSLQILEGAQIDMTLPETPLILSDSSHFNPVDIVCSIKDYKGNIFDLTRYTDPTTGFITSKSYEGRKLKAQELPGLWNGAMSNWNTIFVDTPLKTFNPVKTVMDLLKVEHLGI